MSAKLDIRYIDALVFAAFASADRLIKRGMSDIPEGVVPLDSEREDRKEPIGD